MARFARAAARAERVRLQRQARERAAALRAVRYAEQKARSDAREAAQTHIAFQLEEAATLTAAVQQQEEAINSILSHALARDPFVSPSGMLRSFKPERFNENEWFAEKPDENELTPKPPGFLARLMPGSQRRYEDLLVAAKRRYEAALAHYETRVEGRSKALIKFNENQKNQQQIVEAHNRKIEALLSGLEDVDHESVVEYYKYVLQNNLGAEPDAVSAEVGYAPSSRHLVIDLELPDIDVVPEESSFRYIKSADRIEAVARPAAKRKALYGHLLCQVALKCIDSVFRGGRGLALECLTLNGMLDSIDPATGQPVRVCLLSVRITADTFRALNLRQVHPEHCLRSLKASVSRSPSELVPVKPLVEIDMVDPRFVETLDVMSHLDQRPNLMELSPTEFEGLITNLFGKMGLDTRQTRPSRDGGVDCVAFDQRPIFGGKVVIQAKRYKNTVGVSAVRDLFGTVQNEGASKGILVTTSGYGTAAFDFARGKPLELLDGSNLLHLLAEHANIDARIVMPDAWADIPIHGE